MARTIRQLGSGKLAQNRADALKLAAEQARYAVSERQRPSSIPA